MKLKITTVETIVLIITCVLMAGCYSTIYLLPILVKSLGGDEMFVGFIVSIPTVFVLGISVFAGFITDLLGKKILLSVAAILLAVGLIILGLDSELGAFHILAGSLVGIGWALFYIILPAVIVVRIRAEIRVQYLTIISGSLMLGLSLAPLCARYFELTDATIADIFISFGVIGLVTAPLLYWLSRRFYSATDENVVRLSWAGFKASFSSVVRWPMVMIALNACIFASLSIFQINIAEHYDQDYSLFFLIFTVTVVVARLGLASVLSRFPLEKLLLLLMAVMLSGLFVFLFNEKHLTLYLLAIVLFGLGYGLCYSVLNALVVNNVEKKFQAQALQVFILCYFVGLFGFPYIAGSIIDYYTIPQLLMTLVAIGLVSFILSIVHIINHSPSEVL